MLILSIVPLYLNTDSDGIKANTSNQADLAEHRVMELEALLSSMIVKQYFSGVVEGVDTTSISSVRAELEAARAEELALLSDSGAVSENNTYARLDYIQRMEASVDQRVNDLSTLLAAINDGTTLGYKVSGVDNQSFISVATELERALMYKQELEISKEYWSQVIASKEGAIDDTSVGDDTSVDDDSNPDNQPTVILPIEFSDREQREALSKRTIANIQSIIGSVSQNTDVGEIIAQIDSVKSDLERELKLANIVVSSDGTNQSRKSVSSLNIELKTLFNQKEMRELMSSVSSSLRTQLTDAFNQLAALL